MARIKLAQLNPGFRHMIVNFRKDFHDAYDKSNYTKAKKVLVNLQQLYGQFNNGKPDFLNKTEKSNIKYVIGKALIIDSAQLDYRIVRNACKGKLTNKDTKHLHEALYGLKNEFSLTDKLPVLTQKERRDFKVFQLEKSMKRIIDYGRDSLSKRTLKIVNNKKSLDGFEQLNKDLDLHIKEIKKLYQKLKQNPHLHPRSTFSKHLPRKEVKQMAANLGTEIANCQSLRIRLKQHKTKLQTPQPKDPKPPPKHIVATPRKRGPRPLTTPNPKKGPKPPATPRDKGLPRPPANSPKRLPTPPASTKLKR